MGNLIKETPYSEITATLEVLDHLGINREHLARLRSDPIYAERVLEVMLRGSFEESVHQRLAREIMGKNFFGIEEAIKYFGVNPLYPVRQKLSALAEIPFSEAVLEELKDTHVLIAVFPLSILDIRGKVEGNLFFGHEDAWYNKESFAKERGKANWQLVRKTPVPNSTLKGRNEQLSLISKDDEVPTARVMVYAIIGHYLATGERLFETIYVRTSSVGSNDNHVPVGRFGSLGGFHIGRYQNGRGHDLLGISSARKFPAQITFGVTSPLKFD